MWRFEKEGHPIDIVPEGRLTVNDAHRAVQASSEGPGLARVLENYANPLLATGRVVQVLDDWCPRIPSWYLYYPSRRQMPSATRAFLDFIASKKTRDTAYPAPRV